MSSVDTEHLPTVTRFYSPDTYRAETSVGFLMKRAVASIVAQVDKELQQHDLTNAQWGPLLRLKTCGGSTVADLARCLYVDAGAMTRMLDRLERKGLCRRTRSTEDRRVVHVELTAAGEVAIAEVPAVLCDVLNAHLEGFSQAEWQTLSDLLRRMVDTSETLRENV